MTSIVRGLLAGAAGTTVLNAATYLDMATTGRPASDAPDRTVLASADLIGLDLDISGAREEAYGALAGLGVGTGIGVVAALTRSAGIRLPLLVEAAVIGVGAMAATDGPMAVLKVTDVTSWSGTDWVRDVVPHLAYGTAVAGALRTMERRDGGTVASRTAERSGDEPRPGRLLLRSLAIGVAAGARTSWGLAPAGLAGGRVATVAAASAIGAEVVVDKMPTTPSRLGGATVGRVVSAAVGAATLAREHGAGSTWPAAAAGAVGAVAGTIGGATWREFCAERSWSRVGAVIEDAASLALTVYAVKR